MRRLIARNSNAALDGRCHGANGMRSQKARIIAASARSVLERCIRALAKAAIARGFATITSTPSARSSAKHRSKP